MTVLPLAQVPVMVGRRGSSLNLIPWKQKTSQDWNYATLTTLIWKQLLFLTSPILNVPLGVGSMSNQKLAWNGLIVSR